MIAESARWRVRLLGEVSASCGDFAVSRYRTQKTGLLLAVLCLYPSRARSREELVELFWPESEPTTARQNLRQTLLYLKRILQGADLPELLASDGAMLSVHAVHLSTDVADFRQTIAAAEREIDPAIAAERLREAVKFYGGPLLPGHHDEWVDAERQALLGEYRRALRKLVRWHAGESDLGTALTYARAAVDADFLREESHRDMMRLYQRLGQTSAALAQFDLLEAALRTQVGLAPSERTLRLAAEIRRDDAPRAPLSAAVAPSPVPVSVKSAALPTPLTPFFGREEELAVLKALLTPGKSRLITLIGLGGIGKTRTAIELLRLTMEPYGGRCWFVEVVDVVESVQLLDQIRSTLNLTARANTEGLTLIADFLEMEGRPALIVLDNFEQVERAGVAFVEELRRRCPNLSLVVTSRAALDVAGEHRFALGPLRLPEAEFGALELGANASARLFADRAEMAQPRFRITEATAPDVIAICRLLEGVPLAIELAASWMGVLNLAQIRARLTDRFDLLVSRSRSVVPRHAALRTVVDSTIGLLPEAQRRFFGALSLFHGGWSLAALEAIFPDAPGLEFLADLVDRSLVIAEELPTVGVRYRMLETLRERSLDYLDPDEVVSIRQRHAEYFRDYASWLDKTFFIEERTVGAMFVEVDLANFVAAIEWQGEQPGKAGDAVRTLTALYSYWIRGRQMALGKRMLRQTLERVNQEGAGIALDQFAEAALVYGAMCHYQGSYTEAIDWFSQCQKAAISARNDVLVGRSFVGMGNSYGSTDNHPAQVDSYRAAIRKFEETAQTERLLHTKLNLGLAYLSLDDSDQAQEMLDQVVDDPCFRPRDTMMNTVDELQLLISWLRGDHAGARAAADRSLVRMRQGPELIEDLANASLYVAEIDCDEGNLASSYAGVCQVVEWVSQYDSQILPLDVLNLLGCLCARAGESEVAARLWACSACERRRQGAGTKSVTRNFVRRTMEEARNGLPSFDTEWGAGERMSVGEALEVGMAAGRHFLSSKESEG